MNLEIQGVPATPRGGAKSKQGGEKNYAQGWRVQSRASRSPRPTEVPELRLGKLGDSEDEDVYIPASKGYPRFGPPDSTSTVSWGSPLSAPLAPLHQASKMHFIKTDESKKPPLWEDKTIPENLPAPSERYKIKYKQYEAELKENFKQHSQRVNEKNKLETEAQPLSHTAPQSQSLSNEDDWTLLDEKALLQQCYTSKPYTIQHSMRKLEAEDLAAGRRKQAVVEQVMVDQLSRAVISDPDQNSTSNEQISVQRPGSAPLRFKNRALHDTKVRTRSALTENLLSNKLRFDARILTRSGRDACRELIGFFFAFDKSLTIYEYRHFGKNRSSALPLIQKGSYSHQHGRRKGVQFGIHDFYVGANLTFTTTGHNLPENIKQKPLLTLRITDVDEMAKSMLLASVEDIYQDPTKQEVDDRNTLFSIQGTLKEKLKKRGVRTLTGIGKLFRSLDKSGDGVLQKEQVQLALKEFHLTLSEKDFDAVWRIMDLNCDGEVDYGEFLRAVTGEMNEYRKAFVRKAYMKLDPNKTGSVPLTDIEKFYCAKGHPKVLSGEATEDQLRAGFVETLREACTNRNDVSYCEFEDYYEGLSIGISEDEDFANILKNSWGI
ncbi:calcyphosin-2 isoform X2 [Lepisosteus oculatus]|uniref:calcyphosin-2 isoform X2 n=1 Tax=Lepisosteus oculatus TaxID=7918 RepID=UPI003719C420